MDTGDVGARDFRFGVTGVLLMVIAAILLAILSSRPRRSPREPSAGRSNLPGPGGPLPI